MILHSDTMSDQLQQLRNRISERRQREDAALAQIEKIPAFELLSLHMLNGGTDDVTGAKRTQSLSDGLRDRIRETGLTHYAISKQTGVSISVLDRFMSGERDVKLATVEKLAELLTLKW